MRSARSVGVRALAKINLGLRVLARRSDGYHELRTVFQTISLADHINITYTPGRKIAIELDDSSGIPDNLVVRAARTTLESLRAAGSVEIRLRKRIPVGAGLGGGSSDAAAILLALPVLAGRAIGLSTLLELAAQLGSDIPFFVLGGAAVGIGRGTELYPLPDLPSHGGLLVVPPVAVSTAEAYRRLSPGLTSESQENKIFSFQSHTWDLADGRPLTNDFEPVVFEIHPRLAMLKERLLEAGARAALMTGSGSAVFGLFRTRGEVSRAAGIFGEPRKVGSQDRVFRIALVDRARYRAMWWRALGEHTTGRIWPPQSRYAR
jgi:4-diphosphocytidyl-2-C-methyl-D-erythritol kinase